jgi:ribosomal subunit interface protein
LFVAVIADRTTGGPAVEIVVSGRHIEVPERFRRAADEKLGKIGQLAPKAHRVDVEYAHERNPRQSQKSERVEITVRGKGPVIRAEACSDDPLAALDIAFGKLLERLRRSHDRRKTHHGRQASATPRTAVVDQRADEVFAEALAAANALIVHSEETDDGAAEGTSPVVIRVKDHLAEPMTIDQAVYEMEMVGHAFFLFIDVESGLPSVVYRRVGWNYGVIRLQVDAAGEEKEPAAAGV